MLAGAGCAAIALAAAFWWLPAGSAGGTRPPQVNRAEAGQAAQVEGGGPVVQSGVVVGDSPVGDATVAVCSDS